MAQFEQPETRDVRQIVNKDQAKVEQAKALLEQDDSPASWKKVAARFSTEEATKDSGGLRRGRDRGAERAGLEEQIFSAAEGELVGPFKGQTGYYLIQVEKITPAETTPLAEVTEQIQQQLAQGEQQQVAQDFQQDFLEKWRSRTFCADDYLIDRCDELHAHRSSRSRALAPVIPTPVVSPGQATVFPGQPIPALPQGPSRSGSQPTAGVWTGRSCPAGARRHRPARSAGAAGRRARAHSHPVAGWIAKRSTRSAASTRSPAGCAASAPGTASRTSARSSRTRSRRPTSWPTPRAAATTPSSSTSSATCCSRSTSWRCCSRSAAREASPRSPRAPSRS